HMPYTTYGLLKNIRSHRISSPELSATLKTGRPNACNLCHLDRTLEWGGNYLSLWYQQPKPVLDQEQRTISAAVLIALKSGAGQRALIAWHMGWDPAKKISGEDWLAPYLAQLISDPYPAVRYIANHSLDALGQFRDIKLDFTAPAESASAVPHILQAWSAGPG